MRLLPIVAILGLFAGCVAASEDLAIDEEGPTPVYDARIWISPASASPGVPRTIDVWGSGTDFTSGSTIDFGPGVDVQVLLVDSSHHMRAQILVAEGAEVGLRDVTATWDLGRSLRVLRDGFVVETGSLDLFPRGAALGESVTLDVTGWGTSFSPGLTVATLGPGIEILGDVDVTSSSHLRFDAHVDPRAEVGARDLVVYNGPEVWTLADAFFVDREDRSMRITPNEAWQSSTVEVRVEADDAGFVDGETEADLGTGVVVEEVTVIDAEHLAARLRIGNNARIGLRDVRVTTPTPDGPITRLLVDGFEIFPVEADPLRARVSLSFSIARLWDPDLCAWDPRVNATALFYEPNDFPCPSNGGSSSLSVPGRYDLIGSGYSSPTAGSTDCPAVKTFDAGPQVVFASDDGDVVLPRDYDPIAGRVTYRALDLTVSDFIEDAWFDLMTPGGDLGFAELPAWTIEDALVTMPRDYQQTGPDYCALMHPLDQPLPVRWTLGQTYDTADMYLYLLGPPQDDGFPVLFTYPWDDGSFDITAEQLGFFTPGPALLYQVGTIRNRFEVPGSEFPLAGIASSTINWRGEFLFE